jgi:HlyD family type I secretion membrane fusion protein
MNSTALPDFDFKRQVRWGMLAIALLVAFIAGWSMLAPLSSGAIAPGLIVVDSNRREIQHFDGGIVQEILVKDGDHVLAGDPLIILRTVELENEINKLFAEQLAFLAQNARLEAELSEALKIRFPAIFKEPDNQERKLSLMRRQTALFKARKDNLKVELGIYQQQIEQFYEQISGQRNQLVAFDLRMGLLSEEIDGLEILYQKGLVPQSRLFQLKGQAASLLSQKAEKQSWIAETKIQITEKELQILQTRQSVSENVAESLSGLRSSIFDVEDRLISAREKLSRSSILAPSEGVVFNSILHTIGGVIPRGETFMEIVPQQDRLVVEAEASPLDVDIIRIGDATKVRLSSFSAKLTPLLEGKIVHLAPDSSLSKDGSPIYLLRVEIPLAEIEKLEGAELIPGMPVEVLVAKGEQTLLAYLVRPISAILFRSLNEN